MTKEEILDYVVNTPGNTNRAVLSDMLDGISDGGSEDGYLGIEAVEIPISIKSIPEGVNLENIDVVYGINYEHSGTDIINATITPGTSDDTNKLIVPIINGCNTTVDIVGNGHSLLVDVVQSDFIGNIYLDDLQRIYVNGPGSMNLDWKYID